MTGFQGQHDYNIVGNCKACGRHDSSSDASPCPGSPMGRARVRVQELVERPLDVKEAIMKKAMSIVTGSRRSAYGTPEDNFERIARFWQAYFENTGRGDVKITAQDISPLMRLMKEARLCNSASHPDSFTDLVGYALTGAEMNGLKAEDFD